MNKIKLNSVEKSSDEKCLSFLERMVIITACDPCRGTGHLQEWDRVLQEHVLNPEHVCERCKGSGVWTKLYKKSK